MRHHVIYLFVSVAVVLATRVEFYDLDGKRADPCVNMQILDSVKGPADCSASTTQPPPSVTYLLPSATSPTGRKVADLLPAGGLTINGRFFPTTGFTFLGLSKAGNSDCPNTANPTTACLTCAAPDSAATFVRPGVSADGKQLTFTPPATWYSQAMEAEVSARMLCFGTATALDPVTGGAPAGLTFQWTGFRVGTVWNCNDGSDDATLHCTNIPAISTFDQLQTKIRSARNTCCTTANPARTLRVNQCINPNVESCCGSAAVAPNQQCCSSTVETVAWADDFCYCRRDNNVADCPSGQKCCLQTRYPELILSTDWGQCYNQTFQRCCDVGQRYDPGVMQCCSINGLQSLNNPCPCMTDTDCLGGQVGWQQIDFSCCFQTAPVPYEVNAQSTASTMCNKYNNYPTGNGLISAQRCIGSCMDTKYQVCCNGVVCTKQFERCCNNTCCNRYNGTCQSGTFRSVGTASNWREYNVPYDVCTIVEQIDLIRAWWMFVLPAALLAATLSALALALVFAGRVEHRARRGLEKMMIGAAVIAILFIVPTYFAPVYKYGVVVVWISLFAIITSAARNLYMYVASFVLHIFLLIYLVDPFNGNDYFNLAVDRNFVGRTDPLAAGLWHATTRIWDVHETCWDFYNGYFRFDPLIRDLVRFDEPNNPAFGYCSRGWVTALLIFDGFVYIAVLVQFILSIVALLIRGRMLRKASEVKWE